MKFYLNCIFISSALLVSACGSDSSKGSDPAAPFISEKIDMSAPQKISALNNDEITELKKIYPQIENINFTKYLKVNSDDAQSKIKITKKIEEAKPELKTLIHDVKTKCDVYNPATKTDTSLIEGGIGSQIKSSMDFKIDGKNCPIFEQENINISAIIVGIDKDNKIVRMNGDMTMTSKVQYLTDEYVSLNNMKSQTYSVSGPIKIENDVKNSTIKSLIKVSGNAESVVADGKKIIFDIKLNRLETSVNQDTTSEYRGEVNFTLNNKEITIVKIGKQDKNENELERKIYFNGVEVDIKDPAKK
ncbi:MAG: hypothetical protein AABY64_04965 [Bdellovibrionota bacterium]